MGIYELQIANENLAQYKPGTVLGLENKTNLNFLAVSFGNSVSEIAKNFINNDVIASFTPEFNALKAHSKLESIPYSTLDKFTIRTPEGVTVPMLQYITVLDAAVDEMMTIKERLLKPLKDWCAKGIANPGHLEKAWLDKNLTYMDIDKHIDALKVCYDDTVGDDISYVPMVKAYPRPNDFKMSGEMVKDLVKESTILLSLEIPKMTEEIAGYVKKLVDENDKTEYMAKTPNASIAKLSDCLFHAAREVEFLSVLLFQVKAVSVAYEESVKKIEEQL